MHRARTRALVHGPVASHGQSSLSAADAELGAGSHAGCRVSAGGGPAFGRHHRRPRLGDVRSKSEAVVEKGIGFSV